MLCLLGNIFNSIWAYLPPASIRHWITPVPIPDVVVMALFHFLAHRSSDVESIFLFFLQSWLTQLSQWLRGFIKETYIFSRYSWQLWIWPHALFRRLFATTLIRVPYDHWVEYNDQVVPSMRPFLSSWKALASPLNHGSHYCASSSFARLRVLKTRSQCITMWWLHPHQSPTNETGMEGMGVLGVSLLHKDSASHNSGTASKGDISTARVSERQEMHVVMVFMERFMLAMMHVSSTGIYILVSVQLKRVED